MHKYSTVTGREKGTKSNSMYDVLAYRPLRIKHKKKG
jgi:hypothetical protein